MTNLLIKAESADIEINLGFLTASKAMLDEQFYQFCLSNPELRIERSALGEITIVPPLFQIPEIETLKSHSKLLTGWTVMGRVRCLILVLDLHFLMGQRDRLIPHGFWPQGGML